MFCKAGAPRGATMQLARRAHPSPPPHLSTCKSGRHLPQIERIRRSAHCWCFPPSQRLEVELVHRRRPTASEFGRACGEGAGKCGVGGHCCAWVGSGRLGAAGGSEAYDRRAVTTPESNVQTKRALCEPPRTRCRPVAPPPPPSKRAAAPAESCGRMGSTSATASSSQLVVHSQLAFPMGHWATYCGASAGAQQPWTRPPGGVCCAMSLAKRINATTQLPHQTTPKHKRWKRTTKSVKHQ